MEKKLYEFYIVLGASEINSAFLLEVDKETAKFYFGNASLLNKKSGEIIKDSGRFRVEKEYIDCAQIYRDTTLVVRTFGYDFEDAKSNAYRAFSRMAKNWACRLESHLEMNVLLNERLDAAQVRSSEIPSGKSAKGSREIVPEL